MPSRTELLDWARLAGLVGGVLLLVGAVLNALLVLGMGAFMFGFRASFLLFLALLFGVVGVGAGVVALLAASKLPGGDANRVGITLVVAGAVGLFGGGGFLFGSLSVIGAGAMALMAANRSPTGPPT